MMDKFVTKKPRLSTDPKDSFDVSEPSTSGTQSEQKDRKSRNKSTKKTSAHFHARVQLSLRRRSKQRRLDSPSNLAWTAILLQNP